MASRRLRMVDSDAALVRGSAITMTLPGDDLGKRIVLALDDGNALPLEHLGDAGIADGGARKSTRPDAVAAAAAVAAGHEIKRDGEQRDRGADPADQHAEREDRLRRSCGGAPVQGLLERVEAYAAGRIVRLARPDTRRNRSIRRGRPRRAASREPAPGRRVLRRISRLVSESAKGSSRRARMSAKPRSRRTCIASA